MGFSAPRISPSSGPFIREELNAYAVPSQVKTAEDPWARGLPRRRSLVPHGRLTMRLTFFPLEDGGVSLLPLKRTQVLMSCDFETRS